MLADPSTGGGGGGRPEAADLSLGKIGNGEPLFADFNWEDWALLTLRYELHLLSHAFKKDVDDPERPGFSDTHLSFYYNKLKRGGFSMHSQRRR